MRKIGFPLLLMGVFVICGCFSNESAEETATGGSTGTAITAAPVPAAIALSVDQESIGYNETTQVYASIYNESGELMAGQVVTFKTDNPILGSITSAAGSSSAGVATAFFTARSSSGTVSITASIGDVSSTSRTITINPGTTPSVISLTASPTSVLVGGTSTVSAQVLDNIGNPVSNGTGVAFEVTNTTLGSITQSATTNAGVARATFEALNSSGTATINVTSGSASASINIVILSSPASSIEFVSATPARIALAGTGVNESSVVQFLVKDSNSQPLEGENVSVVMDGPNGGEYIDSSGDGTPDTVTVSSNGQGIAQVILNSGTVAGPVTLSASITVSGQPITVNSSVVSIGGGVPSAKRFTTAVSQRNLPGLNRAGEETEITVYLADRFGNYNVLEGTTISFASESGLAVDTSQVSVEVENDIVTGTATVKARTQPGVTGGPEDVAPLGWETTLINTVNAKYGTSFTGHPRDGWCSVLVYTKGEEHFDDTNANGRYDAGEPFLDSFKDPICDYNDDGLWTSVGDPVDLYIDSVPTNGTFDGVNGVWDSNKNIYTNEVFLITGQPNVYTTLSGGFAVADGGSIAFDVLVCDKNLNVASPGTTVTISTDKGKIAGTTSDGPFPDIISFPDGAAGALSEIEYGCLIYDSSAGDPDPAEVATVTITVVWEGVTMSYQIIGTVD